jgi:cysteinyl-tRNA synthetase
MLQLFDTAKGGVLPLEPRDPGKVSMYVCGPTVDGPPHIGHGRFSLVFDVIRRYLEWSGLDVTYVSNITDIEDKIIARAEREGRDWREIVQRCEAVWYRAMDALNVRRPDHDPHATAYVDQMVALIGRLVDKGVAYETSDGVYFQSERVDDYGLLARQPLDTLKAGARVETGEEKRSPVDFVLWKKAKPGEPRWPSPWGDGRPGWHTECVVMSLDLLGEGFDLHGGGQDLAFPHHENERAQAVADGRKFAARWAHNGFVEVEGTKMSKSLGNTINLVDLVERYDPRAYRLLVLRSHYRAPIDVTDDSLRDAEAALARLDAFARRVAASVPGVAAGDVEADPAAIERFRTAMDDDLHTQSAVALVFDLVREANAALDAGDAAAAGPPAAAVVEIAGALGLELDTAEAEVPDEVTALARERNEARAARDWARADALRDQITTSGYTVEDTPSGPVVRPA